MSHPKHNITANRAYDLIEDGHPLIEMYVQGNLIIEISEIWDKEVVFENCIIEYFSGSITQFGKRVKMTNCYFKNCQFVFSYLLSGLTIDNCTFDGYLDFQAGGHNRNEHAIQITNNTFKKFVNFFDCWYESEVIICNNNFSNGTNLLGSPHKIPVTFDKGAIIKDNIGQLDSNSEV